MRSPWRPALWCAVALATAAAGPAAAPGAPQGAITFMISGEPAEKAAYDALIQAFARRQPRVKVKMVYVPDARTFPKRLLADFAAGAPPDVFLLNYRRYAPFAVKGVLEPLDAWMDKTDIKRS